ncbi:TPA: hypothetical protein ACX6PO_003800 [Photobacterium damselae]
MTYSVDEHSTITKQPEATQGVALSTQGSSKNEIIFSVKKGSDISPVELKQKGVRMINFKYVVIESDLENNFKDFHLKRIESNLSLIIEFIRIW